MNTGFKEIGSRRNWKPGVTLPCLWASHDFLVTDPCGVRVCRVSRDLYTLISATAICHRHTNHPFNMGETEALKHCNLSKSTQLIISCVGHERTACGSRVCALDHLTISGTPGRVLWALSKITWTRFYVEDVLICHSYIFFSRVSIKVTFAKF